MVHFMVGTLLLERKEDPRLAAPGYIAWAELFGSEPDGIELVRLTWGYTIYRWRVKNELPSADLLAFRERLLAGIARLEPLRDHDETRQLLLNLAVLRNDEDNPTEAAVAIAPRIAEIGEVAAVFSTAAGMEANEHTPLIRAVKQELMSRVLQSDPLSPRYDAFLIVDSTLQPPDDAPRHLRELIRTGLAPYHMDDAWVLYAAMMTARGPLPWDARTALRAMLDAPRRTNATSSAAFLLARDESVQGRTRDAIAILEHAEKRYGIEQQNFDMEKARLLSALGRHRDALFTLEQSLQRGGPEYLRWYLLAREHQHLGNDLEAVRLYQFYLTQVLDRASGALPLGPAASLNEVAEAHAAVWYRIAEIYPAFFGRSGMRQFAEMLAVIAACLFAAARVRRARAFLLPGALAAEIVFFCGFTTLRVMADGAPVPFLWWAWLAAASVRTLVLVAGGLYLSALAGLPRHTRAVAGPAVAAGAAVLAGLAFGLAEPPLFVVEGMPAVARVAELGLAPRAAAEIPVMFVTALRFEAAARLVWPALLLLALPARGPLATPVLAVPLRELVAIAVAALLASAGAQGGFLLAAAGAIALGAARLRWGALAPFLLHLAYAAGATAGAFVLA